MANKTENAVHSVSWPSQRTHRQELELALISRLGDYVTSVPQEACDNAKMMLDRLLARDAVDQSLDTAFQELATPSAGAVLRGAGYGNASCGGCQKVDTIKLPVVDAGADALEREIKAKGLTAPRVTKEDIEAEITHTYYINVGEAHRAKWPDPTAADETHPTIDRLTLCILVLKNGFAVTGESACVSPENFDAQMGRDYARANAIEKMWLLLG